MTAILTPSPTPPALRLVPDLAPTAPVRSHVDPVPVARVRSRPGPVEFRRRRLVALAVVVGLGLGLASLGRSAGAARPDLPGVEGSVTYVVQPGDTLWGIAERIAPGTDPRPVVAELAGLAGGTSLQPGQRLVVPLDLLG